MKEYVKFAGRMVPVSGSVRSERFGAMPLLDIPLMSDERWNAMCRDDFLRKYEREHGPQAEFPERAFIEYCAEIRRQCAAEPSRVIPVVYYA